MEYAYVPGTTQIVFVCMSFLATYNFSGSPPIRIFSPMVYSHNPLCFPTVLPVARYLIGPGSGGIYDAVHTHTNHNEYCTRDQAEGRNAHKNRLNFPFSPTKQRPMLSCLSAVGSWNFLASSLTSLLGRCPIGKSTRRRLASEMEAR